MFGKHFMLNEETRYIVEEIGRHMPGGFFIYKAEKPEELLYANHAVLEIFGCSDLDEFKELTGYTFKGIVYPDDYEAVTASIEEQIACNENRFDHVIYRITRKDGVVRWVDDYGHYTDTKEYGGIFYVFISDITDKKSRDDRQTKEMTQRIIAQNKALSDALKEAEEARNASLSNVNSEIMTPLNEIIELNRSAMSDPYISDRTREYLEKIGANADLLLDTIKDILKI